MIGGMIGAVFLTLDYWIDREVHHHLDQMLWERSRAVEHAFQHPSDLAALERLMPQYDAQGHTEYFTVFDADGRALATSSSSAGQPLPKGAVRGHLPQLFDLTLPDGHAGRALATTLPGLVRQGRPGMLVVVSEREDWGRTEFRIHSILLGGTVLALVLMVLLGIFVIRHVFTALRHAGDQISGLDAAAPLNPIGQAFPVELRPFAEAFNTGVNRLYEALDRERRFSENVAHELRTPIAEIRASAEAALASGDAALAKAGMQHAVAACTRMQRSVDTLLLLTRLESGQDVPELDPMDLAATVDGLLSGLSGTAQARSRRVAWQRPASAWVRSDIGIVERILSNLLRNALEYAPEGSTITCQLRQGGTGWWFEISNVAGDLVEADLQHFGQRFWRKQSEGATAHHAGLGLALTRGLTQALRLPLRFELRQGRLHASVGPWPAL